ncbi:MAG: ABC transporter ATP-binding protein [Panacagrimonas sp.]
MLKLQGLRTLRGQGANSFELHVPLLHVAKGELVAVTGRSGSGKSSLLEILGLILEPQETEVFELSVAGQTHDLRALWRQGQREALAGLRARALGFVLQTGGLLPFLSVEQNIATPRRLVGMPARGDLADEIPDALGIGALRRKKPAELSIGERQRAAIARALAHRPELLLADEPTAALDPEHAEKVFELLIGLVRRYGMSAIIVTHDWELVRRLGLREIRGAPIHAVQGAASRFVPQSSDA